MTDDNLPMAPVAVVLTEPGFQLAETLKPEFPDLEIHGLQGRVTAGDHVFDSVAGHLRSLFEKKHPIIAVCSAGIVIRALANRLDDKRGESPVVALSEDGRFAVPLLGGHRGANDMAVAIARKLNAQAAITTAGDARFGVALDAPPKGWTVANPEIAKTVMAGLLAGGEVRIKVDAGDADWLEKSRLPVSENGQFEILITDKIVDNPGDVLVMHPPTLALGVGCERGTDGQELTDLALKTLADNGLSKHSVAAVVSLDLKENETAVHQMAHHLQVPARFFRPDRLEAEAGRLQNPSDVVFKETGCHGVAEGAALAATGNNGDLIAGKQKSKRATVAVARASGNLNGHTVGKAQGKLTIIGIGPGVESWRTPAASRAIENASDIVGYQLYLDLLGDLISGKNVHHSRLAQEEARVRAALDLAASGKSVALVCSGDAGIYALATLAFELLDMENRADWNRLEIVVEPGVSALQAAAARIGAPIGHDFCTVSLSDLLTPWDTIRRRIEAAASGDFIISFYNPVSKTRRSHLMTAKDILLKQRPVNTPVILARNLGRKDETVRVIELQDLTIDDADMLTLVMVGNSQSQWIKRGHREWVYTPRGYAEKMQEK